MSNIQAPTLAALLPKDRPLTKDDVLRLIVRRLIRPLFLRRHLKREQVLGVIGEKGGGKSATTSTAALTDQLLDGKKVYSNIDVACDIEVGNETAQRYGLSSGGKVHYETIHLEKNALLKLDEKYRNGALIIEEINVQYSNVRRFMSNTNVDFNEVVQQLRKLQTSLYYNVIDEMFIDSQLRSMTDAFIKCEDTAYTTDNLAARKPQGQDFKWLIYPMTGNFAGHEKTYYRTKKPLPPIYFHFTKFHGIFNTEYSQHQGIYSQSRKTQAGDIEIMMSVESSPENIAWRQQWGWVAEKAIELKRAGKNNIEPWELAEIMNRPITKEFRGILSVCHIRYDRFTQKYKIDDFSIERERVGSPSL